MRRVLVSSLLLASSVSSAYELPFGINIQWPANSAPNAEVASESRAPRVAVIGAGAGGSSAAFWIAKAKERHGLDVEVDIYEQSDYIGGRSTTVYPHNDTSLVPIELGASIFVRVNKNMWRASEEFNISRYGFEDEEGALGIWDGTGFVLTQGENGGRLGSWLDNIKALWRYGYYSPTHTTKLVKDMTDKFVQLYTPAPPQYTNIAELVDAFGWRELVTQTGSDYFQSNGISKRYTNELIEAATRVNYAQDVDTIHALEAACSLAASGAASAVGGNWQIFDNFVKASGAHLHLNTKVNAIERKSGSQWTVKTSHGAVDYKAVILATPYHTSDIILPSDLSKLIPKQPYIHLHVTLLSTTAPSYNPEYFGLAKGAKAPQMVLTTLDGVRNGGKVPEFNSINYLRKIVKKNATEAKEGPEEWAVKIFSMAPVSDEWLSNLFQGQVGWVLRKEWDSYPVLPPTDTFPPVQLDQGLFYVNAFEPFISTMETETVSSRYIVDWLLREEFDSSICPPSAQNVSDARTADEDFVYGWDC
ncbi:FAD/NAD-P-binding domain-containing protein [Artomyces pyxidatus]|uniref:FAD/NAD-P-binding domain-containing protein n=1 Tax=Artomyces pyxidatus TaxID=48021 RepID=A0ACB8T410_9AGAM|nr:FAD/NAD-P-binding domain-containing protein [Artomyces pyxidatus]